MLKSDGSLWAMGDNSSGQLGDCTTSSTNRPEQIVSGGAVAPPVPRILSLNHSGPDLILQAGNGIAGSTYYALTSTSLALALNQWLPVATNAPSGSGDFIITAPNAFNPDASPHFYILEARP